MAAYPSYTMQRDGTRAVVDGGFNQARATNGALRVQRLFSSAKRTFEITHWLTPAEKTAHAAFFNSNKDLDVSLTWPEDSVTYTARFIAEPQYLLQTPGLWIATVRMAEA